MTSGNIDTVQKWLMDLDHYPHRRLKRDSLILTQLCYTLDHARCDKKQEETKHINILCE